MTDRQAVRRMTPHELQAMEAEARAAGANFGWAAIVAATMDPARRPRPRTTAEFDQRV